MNNFPSFITQRSFWWTLILFLILPLLAFPELIFGGQTLYRTDISWIHYPGHIFMAEEWLAGRVPLWDPYRQAGVPMLAEPQIGVLYPLRVLFLSPLSPSLELSLFILIHFPLAALATYLLARLLQMSRAAATVAGLVFGFGGFLMAQMSNVNIMTAAAWLPLVLYAFIQATRRRRWSIALLAGIPLALQISTAHSQIVFYTLTTLVAYWLYSILADFISSSTDSKGKLSHALHTGLLGAVVLISGLLLAAPQLLPSLELLPFTLRSQGRGLDLLTENSLHPALWLNLLLPSAFGNNVVKFRVGDPFQEVFIYVGFIPLILVVVSAIGLRSKSRRGESRDDIHSDETPGQAFSAKSDRLFFLLLLLGAILLALGRYTPLYQYVIQYLPGFDLFRIPARWLMVVNLALAILAGFGFDVLIEQGFSRRGLFVFWLVGLLLLGGMILIWVFQADLSSWSERLDEPYRKLSAAFLNSTFTINPIYQERLLLPWVFGMNTPALLLLANLLISASLLTLWATGRLSCSAFAGLTIVAIAFDLTLAGGTTINPIRSEQRWQQLSGGARYVLDHVGNGRVFPLGVSGEDAAIRNLGQYFPSVYRVYSASGYSSPLKLARYETFLDEAHPVQAIQVFGVRYLLTQGQMGADAASTYPLAYSDDDSFVYENKNPLPRAFIVHQAIQVSSPTEALAYFKNRDLNSGQIVILESDTPIPALTPGALSTASTATIIRENPQVVEIQTQSAAASYLVLLDTFYPGWVATVDGQETPIYRANYLARAIFLPPGEHLVRFEYRPSSFKWGLWLSLLMAIMTVVMALFGRRRKALF